MGDITESRPYVIYPYTVTEVDDVSGTIRLDRPLRLDVRPEWNAVVLTDDGGTIREVGVESLRMQFPDTKLESGVGSFYGGIPHFSIGHNGIEFYYADDCWARDMVVVDSDNGFLATATNRVTFTDIKAVEHYRISPVEFTDMDYDTGHHAVQFNHAQDCLFTNFEILQRFAHGITVDGVSMGNVISFGYMKFMLIDHHGGAPYENLYSNIRGLHRGGWYARNIIWDPSGGNDPIHAGARMTAWNLTLEEGKVFGMPPAATQGYAYFNIIGGDFRTPNVTLKEGHTEHPGDVVFPQDLHTAMLERRLKGD
jgi:hypothetical protein